MSQARQCPLLLMLIGELQRGNARRFLVQDCQLLLQLRVVQQAEQLFHADGLRLRVAKSKPHQRQQQLMVRRRPPQPFAPG